MQCSILKKSDCAKYDFGHLLFSPEFFLEDKLGNWENLDKRSSKVVDGYFLHVKDTVQTIDQNSICYDLTDGLPKFFDRGIEISAVNSTKKVAKEGDFAISRLRSYLEEMGVVESREKPQIFSTEFLVFREKTNTISAHTLFALCMTKIVQTILKRGQYGTEHPRFYDFLLTRLPVPDCLLSMDAYIKKAIQLALKNRSRSIDIYTGAQTILLSELGLTVWKPKRELSFVKNFSDTKKVNRIDAEYFQPKYEEIIKAIKSYAGGWDTLRHLVTLKDKNFKPKNKKKYKYIELANIADNGEIADFMLEEGQHLPTRARREVTTGDVIVSSIEGSLSSIASIGNEYNQALCSTGFHVIKSEAFNSETLLVLLKSVIGQLQLKKGCGGTILTAINKDEFGKIVLPRIEEEKQTQIQQKITESFALRKQSKRLLECAKQAVEIAIEQNEKTAISWLEKQMDLTEDDSS